MAKLPDKFSLSGPASLRSGRTIADWDTSGIGRGVVALGAGLRSVGGEFSAIGEQQKREGIVLEGASADGNSAKELSDFRRGFDADADYGTFGPRFEKGAAQIRDKWAAKISDPKARQLWAMEFDKRVVGMRDDVLQLSDRRTREGNLVDYKSGLEGFQSIIADANVSEAERARAKDSANAWVDAAAGQGLLSPSEADTWRKNVIEVGEFVLGQRLIEQDPKVIGGGVSQDVRRVINEAAARHGVDAEALARIAVIESSGNPSAKNPNSSAGGLFQFIDSTAKSYGLSNKYDAAQASDAAARLMKDNAAHLRRTLKREPTMGELYLAHQQGAGGAAALLSNPSALATSIVGAEAVRLNGGAPGMTAGEFAAKWIRKAEGASAKIPDWYANQSPDNQLRLENMAASRQGQLDAAAAAQSKAERDGANDDFRLRIAAGDPSLLPGDILGDGRLDNGQKATLLNTYNEKYEENIRTGLDIQALQGGALSLNAFDNDDQKRADNLYDTLMKSVEGNPSPAMEPAAARQYIAESIVRSGVVPKGMMDMLRAGVQSTNTADVVAALQQAQRISQINPAALGRRDGGAAVQSAADDFSYYVNGLNLSPEDAARRIMDARDPEKMRTRKALEPLAKDFLKAAAETDISSMFDPGILSSAPELGFNAEQEAGIKADFMAIAEDQFYRANGDPELALNRAEEQMKRLYGATNVTGRPVLMKHPPEHYWPKFRVTKYGNTDYVGGEPSLDYAVGQLKTDLSELYPNVDMGNVSLVTTPETDAMVKRGEAPGYAVIYQDENGVMQTLPGKLWMPDFKAVQGRVAPIENAEKQRREDAARRNQDMIRDLLPSLTEEAERFRRSPTPGDMLNPFRSLGGGEEPVVPAEPQVMPQPDLGAMP